MTLVSSARRRIVTSIARATGKDEEEKEEKEEEGNTTPDIFEHTGHAKKEEKVGPDYTRADAPGLASENSEIFNSNFVLSRGCERGSTWCVCVCVCVCVSAVKGGGKAR